MNVPSASHIGGVWERQIRSVRNVLLVLLENNGNQLDDESLSTFMCEAEAIINSRPLTVDGLADPDSLAPLTPNHLLTMKSKKLPGRWHVLKKTLETRSTSGKRVLVSLEERIPPLPPAAPKMVETTARSKNRRHCPH